jgi:DNA-binding NtrC family response regulator
METILLIDDDREIRRGLRFALQELGYFVVEAEGSEAAIQHTSDFSLKIDLLLTDAECAKECGVELAAWIQQIQPDMGVLCMTTSVEQLADDRALPSRGWSFIEKPFQFTYLAQKVREVLDANVPNARHFIDELKPIDPGHPYLAQCGIRKETAQHFGAGCYAGPGPMRGRVVIPIRDGLGELLAYAKWAIDQSSMKNVCLPQFDP